MRTSTCASSRHRWPCTPPRRVAAPKHAFDLLKAVRDTLANTAPPRARTALMRLLLARDADGERVLSRAARHRDTVDQVMKALFTSTMLSFEDKRALMVRSLHLIGRDPCDAQTLLDAVVGALNHLHDGDASGASHLRDALNAVLPFVLRTDANAGRTVFEARLARRDIALCRTALVELLLCTRADGLTCCVYPATGRALVHRLLAHEETAPLFLDLVLLLRGALHDWPVALEKVLFATTHRGCTPLWTADLAARGVADTITSVVHSIAARDDLCINGKRRLLLGFASPPACARRVSWGLIRLAYARAFEPATLDEVDGARRVELAVLRRFARWDELLAPAFLRQRVADVVVQHALPTEEEAARMRRLTRRLRSPHAPAAQPPDNNSTA